MGDGPEGTGVVLSAGYPPYRVRLHSMVFSRRLPGDPTTAFPRSFSVELTGPGLSVVAQVPASPRSGTVTLPEFFSDLPAWPRGEEGEQSWMSSLLTTREIHAWDDWPGPDNQLRVIASMSARSHMSLTFVVVQRGEHRWPELPVPGFHSAVTVTVPQTELTLVASRMRTFFRNPQSGRL